ncbi:DUF2834 domain-containing protein [Phaeobacter sp. CAU 1743]|uniref:DUF2834 domain-containing protein n=1 Tax=Phaeobacter sp. CAU 1743 TaxID=3140367 RepID=UPI0023B3EAF2
MRTFYAVSAIIGTLVPWLFFGSFFALNGIDIPAFLRGLFANGAAAGFSADVLLSILVFWVWSWRDARDLGLRRWWLLLPAGCTVGLSLALPLYLWMREGRMGAA